MPYPGINMVHERALVGCVNYGGEMQIPQPGNGLWGPGRIWVADLSCHIKPCHNVSCDMPVSCKRHVFTQ
jgi:hypothetical protein